MEIPKLVKINHRTIYVKESARGYVSVGKTTEHMNDEKRRKIVSLSHEKHIKSWQDEMYKLFELALKKERIRKRLVS